MWINKELARILFTRQARYKVAYGGRGSSKSIGFGTGVIKYALENANTKILCVRGTQTRISDSSLQILKDVIHMMGVSDFFEMTEHTLQCKNGTDFLFYGAKAYQGFRSLQGVSLCWVDEATELSHEAWEVLIPSIRIANSEFWLSFNPEEETDWVYQQFIINKHPDAEVLELNYDKNPYFPEVLRKEMEYDREHDVLKFEHVWLGKLRSAVEGALWNKSLIKYQQSDNFSKIIVAVDPSVTSTGHQDACGLVVCGEKDGIYYVLEDASGILSPEQWASKAVSLYEKWEADHITYETNQGGDLVKIIIQKIQPIRCIGVHASKGKLLRAEPILFLYEKDIVRHLRPFPDLEYEMLTYSGDPKQKSPNRLDAMVWGLTDLSQSKRSPRGMVRADLSNMNREMRQVGTMTPRYDRF